MSDTTQIEKVNNIQSTPKDANWYWLNPDVTPSQYHEIIQWNTDHSFWNYAMLDVDNNVIFRDSLEDGTELYYN